MLHHMANTGALQLDEAVSARQEAMEAWPFAKMQENMEQIWPASDWLKVREHSAEWIAFKVCCLGEDGLCILTHDTKVIHLMPNDAWLEPIALTKCVG